MEQITTHPYQLEKKRYFNLLVTLFLKRRWYFIAIIAGITLYHIPKFSEDGFARFFVFFGIIYLPLNIYRLYRWAYSKANANYFVESVLTADNSFLYFKDVADNENKISVATFIKMTQTKNEYLLYLSQNNFSYIPKSAFKSEEDRAFFEKVIHQNIDS